MLPDAQKRAYSVARGRSLHLVVASPDLHATMRHLDGAVIVSPLFSSLNVGSSRWKVQTCRDGTIRRGVLRVSEVRAESVQRISGRTSSRWR